jgi:hypothetical protein
MVGDERSCRSKRLFDGHGQRHCVDRWELFNTGNGHRFHEFELFAQRPDLSDVVSDHAEPIVRHHDFPAWRNGRYELLGIIDRQRRHCPIHLERCFRPVTGRTQS